jgi:Flp pilus assembly pilin Flp
MFHAILQAVLDDRGQDVIEYALLAAALALPAAAAWPLLTAAIGQTYRQFDTATQRLWVPPDPGGLR